MKILSFGEVLWDVYYDGAVLGGAPLNFAAHSKIQGAEAYLISSVGDDELGKKTLDAVNKLGVSTKYVTVNGEKETGKCVVTLDENATPSYDLLSDVSYDYIESPDVSDEDFDVLAFGTLALRAPFNKESLKKLLKNKSFKNIYSDLNIRPPFYSDESINLCLSNATIVKISDEELGVVTRSALGETLPAADAAKKLTEKFSQISLVIITMGGEGSLCFEKKTGKIYTCGAYPAEVISTVGAGDSFSAAFLSEYLRSGSIAASLDKAAKVSAYVVSKKEAIPDGTPSL